MAGKQKAPSTGIWIVKDVPRDLMYRIRVDAAIQKKTFKQLLFDLAEAHLQDLRGRGYCPKGSDASEVG